MCNPIFSFSDLIFLLIPISAIFFAIFGIYHRSTRYTMAVRAPVVFDRIWGHMHTSRFVHWPSARYNLVCVPLVCLFYMLLCLVEDEKITTVVFWFFYLFPQILLYFKNSSSINVICKQNSVNRYFENVWKNILSIEYCSECLLGLMNANFKIE